MLMKYKLKRDKTKTTVARELAGKTGEKTQCLSETIKKLFFFKCTTDVYLKYH